jgi:hypothetical protein
MPREWQSIFLVPKLHAHPKVPGFDPTLNLSVFSQHSPPRLRVFAAPHL